MYVEHALLVKLAFGGALADTDTGGVPMGSAPAPFLGIANFSRQPSDLWFIVQKWESPWERRTCPKGYAAP